MNPAKNHFSHPAVSAHIGMGLFLFLVLALAVV